MTKIYKDDKSYSSDWTKQNISPAPKRFSIYMEWNSKRDMTYHLVLVRKRKYFPAHDNDP